MPGRIFRNLASGLPVLAAIPSYFCLLLTLSCKILSLLSLPLVPGPCCLDSSLVCARVIYVGFHFLQEGSVSGFAHSGEALRTWRVAVGTDLLQPLLGLENRGQVRKTHDEYQWEQGCSELRDRDRAPPRAPSCPGLSPVTTGLPRSVSRGCAILRDRVESQIKGHSYVSG